MATDPGFLDQALDLFGGMGRITTGRMFSGTALYVEGDVVFAYLLQGTIFMKSDATTDAAYRAAGSQPFTYARAKGLVEARGLMSLPEAAMDDPEAALHWARLSIVPARAAAQRRRAEKARKAARKG